MTVFMLNSFFDVFLQFSAALVPLIHWDAAEDVLYLLSMDFQKIASRLSLSFASLLIGYLYVLPRLLIIDHPWILQWKPDTPLRIGKVIIF